MKWSFRDTERGRDTVRDTEREKTREIQREGGITIDTKKDMWNSQRKEGGGGEEDTTALTAAVSIAYAIDEVEAVAQTGAKLIVSPNTNYDVICRSKQLGLYSYPGVMTPTECFAALDAGAGRDW